MSWKFDIENCPKDRPVVLASPCGKVAKSQWLAEAGRWEFYTVGQQPVAYAEWLEHPFAKTKRRAASAKAGKTAAAFPKRYKDALGEIRIVGEPAEGYVMVRRPGAMVFALSVKALLNQERHPVHGPFEVVENKTAGRRSRSGTYSPPTEQMTTPPPPKK